MIAQRRTAWTYSLIVAALGSPFAAAQIPTYNDVIYATAPLDAGGVSPLRLDVWPTTSGAARAPLVVWIHGGGWQSGTYNNPPPGLQAMLEAGFAVASVQYRLSGVAIFPAQIHDVKGAVRFLRAHADEYGLDPSRFAAWGSSAGGHLTALLATSGSVAALEGATGGNLQHSSVLQAAVDYFGPTNLLTMNADVTIPPGSGINHDASTSPESRLIGFDGPGEGIGVLRENLTNPAAPYPEKSALVALVNPMSHVDAQDPPMFIAHGTLDTSVPAKQSQRLADALAGVGVDHVLRPVVGAGHGFGEQTATVNAEAIAFLVDRLMQPVGDYDRDHDVDGVDFLAWQRQLGTTASPAGSGADGNVDGTVDVHDLSIWEDNFGAFPSVESAALGAPEPGTAEMVVIVAVACAALGRRRQATDGGR